MIMNNKAIEKAQKDRIDLAVLYDVPPSCVVWKGNNKYIVIKNGKEILV